MDIIHLQESFFVEKEKVLFESGALTASTFIYSTGIRAVRLSNDMGHIVMLPYNGQMIWEAVFEGRSIGMKTLYGEPRNVPFWLDTYGCYFMHCGALRMGCPGPEDTHPIHGELPYARYDSAAVVAGADKRGEYIGLTGVYEYNRGFAEKYHAKPVVRLYKGSGMLDIGMDIENLTGYPMELMYMAHINNRAVTGGEFVQSFGAVPENMSIRATPPSHNSVGEGLWPC